MLTDLQKRNLTRFFTIYDFDRDGYLTHEDPQAVINNLAGIRHLEQGSTEFNQFRDGFMLYWDSMLEMVDVDHHGRITLEEWLSFHDKVLPDREHFKQVILMGGKFMFDLMDSDKNGELSLEEYREWMHAFRIPHEEIAEEVFHHLDLNDNGTITMDEMEKIIVQFYYSDDPDAPGHWALGRP